MRIAVASTTIGSLVLSTALPKSYLLALANSIAPKDFAEMYDPGKAAWDERSRHLRKKIKAKLELKKKLRTGQAYLATLEEECDPEPMPNTGSNLKANLDLGILDCNEGEYCIQDSSSSTGGICAKLVNEDSSVVRARGKTNYEDIGDWMVAGDKQLKMLTVSHQLRVQQLLKENELKADQFSSLGGEECFPGTNYGYIDVGANGCQNSTHYCVEDPTSNLGGTCVHVDLDVNDSFIGRFRKNYFDQKVSCQYINGTAGFKCTGVKACFQMSDEFKRNNIGCG